MILTDRRTCPECHDALTVDTDIVDCDGCGQVMHEDCQRRCDWCSGWFGSCCLVPHPAVTLCEGCAAR